MRVALCFILSLSFRCFAVDLVLPIVPFLSICNKVYDRWTIKCGNTRNILLKASSRACLLKSLKFGTFEFLLYLINKQIVVDEPWNMYYEMYVNFVGYIYILATKLLWIVYYRKLLCVRLSKILLEAALLSRDWNKLDWSKTHCKISSFLLIFLISCK